MAIRAFAEAGRALGEPAYVDAAVRCATFVLAHLRDERGRLLRSWRGGVAGGPGFADDHAMMAAACLTLYETTWDLRWFVEARALADELIRLFFDDERGGFFQTGHDAEALVVRPKELYDNAVPSGNSVAAEVLLRLAMFTGEPEYERLAASALRLVRDAMGPAPTGFGHALCALDLYLGPGQEVAIVGDPDDERTRALAAEVGGTLPAERRAGRRRARRRGVGDRPAPRGSRDAGRPAHGLRLPTLHVQAPGHRRGRAPGTARRGLG